MPTQIDLHLYHDVQAALCSLVGKAKQLLGNCTTNLAECWMHIRTKFDLGKVIIGPKVVLGSTDLWELHYSKIWEGSGD